MRGLIYRSPFLYNLAVKMLYGKDFVKRYKIVADNIDKRWSVLDLCCGDCHVKTFLDPSVKYKGMDFNEKLMEGARKKGVDVAYCDLKNGLTISEKYDCVIMMGSLHQFVPNEDAVIIAMKKAAGKRIIISESCRHMANSKHPAVSLLARFVSNPGDDSIPNIKRFSLEEVMAIFRRHGATNIIDAGKDIVGVFDL